MIAGMTQMTLAKKLGYHNSTISHWEKGDAVPSRKMKKHIREFFGALNPETEEAPASTTEVDVAPSPGNGAPENGKPFMGIEMVRLLTWAVTADATELSAVNNLIRTLS